METNHLTKAQRQHLRLLDRRRAAVAHACCDAEAARRHGDVADVAEAGFYVWLAVDALERLSPPHPYRSWDEVELAAGGCFTAAAAAYARDER